MRLQYTRTLCLPKKHFCVARSNAVEIFLEGVPPVETSLGELTKSGCRVGRSSVFEGASYPHESAWKSVDFKSDAQICIQGLLWASLLPLGRFQKCRKERSPVSTMLIPCRSQALTSSGSSTEPPGWIMAETPSFATASTLSIFGRNPSEAMTLPLRSCPYLWAFSMQASIAPIR